MIDRFEGESGNRRLTDLLSRQMVLAGSGPIAETLAGLVAVRAVPDRGLLIQQDGTDTELYFVLSGRVSIQVNGREVAVRGPGTHVGEMAMIDPAAKRCANVVAIGDTVVAAVAEAHFTDLAQRNPQLWRMLALELGNRLRQRNELVTPKNPRPALFIGSSAEALPFARAIESGLQHDDFYVKVWTCNIFQPSHYAIDDLLAAVRQADFAVLVISADDRVTSRGERSDAPRDNVVYELGLAMGSLGRERTIMVIPRGVDLKIPTDLLGLTPITFKVGPEGDLPAAIGPVCNELRTLIRRLGCK
jgi:CRP/FNR family transcriptional regulator, cyclic AMP receptor protein